MENVDCFHFFAITNNAAKNIHVGAFVNIYLQFVFDFLIPWTVDCQASLSKKFSREEY